MSTIEKGFTIRVLDYGYVRYVDHMGDDKRIVEAARVSYKSGSKGDETDKKLLGYLWKNRHTSPFEMVKLTLNIKLPIFVMRQYVRHRMQNLNEVSARYTELPEEFYVPAVWRLQDRVNKQGSISPDADETMATAWHDACIELTTTANKVAYDVYQNLIRKGVAKEMARFVLPVNIYTECYVTWDLKNLLHFITLRDDAHAQYEHQQYGKAIKEICKQLFPWTMEAYEKYQFKCVESV